MMMMMMMMMVMIMMMMYTAISKKVVGKSARDNLKRYCGWLSSLFFTEIERMALEAMDICSRVLKESTDK